MKLISIKRIELPYILFTIPFLFHTGFSPGLGCARAYGQNIGFRNLTPAIMAGCNSAVKKTTSSIPVQPRHWTRTAQLRGTWEDIRKHVTGQYLDENLVEAPESETLINPLCQPRLPLEEVSTLRRSSSII